MNESEKFQRAVKQKLIEVVNGSTERNSNKLTGEVIAGLVDVSFKTIYRILADANYLPSPELAPALERFCDSTKELREAFASIMSSWNESVFTTRKKEIGGIFRFMFRADYISVLESKRLTDAEKVEGLTVQVLKDYIKEVRERQAVDVQIAAAEKEIAELKLRLKSYEK